MAHLLDAIPWARRLKLRHLEVFLALHETGSLTAAAAQLHMTQPALSHWLADVESVIGRPLFVRGRRLTLTDDGEVLRAHAARMLGDVQRTHTELEAMRAGMRGRLIVGTGLPRVLLPKAIVRLHAQRADIFVSVIEAPQPQLLDLLARREIDIVIGALSAPALRSGFASEALLEDSVQVVARSGHPLLRRPLPRWEDTAAHPWILPPMGSVMRQALDDGFAARRQPPPLPCVEANSSLRVQLLLGEPDYLSILCASEVQMYRPLGWLDSLALAPAVAFPDIGALWEKEREGALLAHFLEALRHEARALSAAA